LCRTTNTTGDIRFELLCAQINNIEHGGDDASDIETISISTSAWRRAQQRSNPFLAESGPEQLSLQLLGCEHINVMFALLCFVLLRAQIHSSEDYIEMQATPNTILTSARRHTIQRKRRHLTAPQRRTAGPWLLECKTIPAKGVLRKLAAKHSVLNIPLRLFRG
jgi:hypothetical protein